MKDTDIIIDATSGALLSPLAEPAYLTKKDIEVLISKFASLGSLSFYGAVKRLKQIADKENL